MHATWIPYPDGKYAVLLFLSIRFVTTLISTLTSLILYCLVRTVCKWNEIWDLFVHSQSYRFLKVNLEAHRGTL